MSGVTPLVDTLLPTNLAQRTDLIPLKPEVTVPGPEPVPKAEKNANDPRLPSRAAIDRKLGSELLDQRDAHDALRRAATDGSLKLSATARAISAILGRAQGDAAALAVRGSVPLWRLPDAPAAHLLAPTLARTVASSGLFYESHLLRYARGKFTLEQLAQEPQARLGPLAKSSPELVEGRAQAEYSLREALAFAALKPAPPQGTHAPAQVQTQTQTQTQPQATAQVAQQPTPGSGANQPAASQMVFVQAGIGHSSPVQTSPNRSGDGAVPDQSEPAPAMTNPSSGARVTPSSGAAAYLATSLRTGFPPAGEAGSTTTNTGAPPSAEPMRSTSYGPTSVHPETVALVRQQLELLAVPVFRWSGEAWPGVKMDWEIGEQRDEQQEAPESATRGWNTRLNVTLPLLGPIEVHLSLTGNALQARLAATEETSVDMLRKEGKALRERLAAAGLQLNALQVVPLTAQPATPDTGDHGADVGPDLPGHE